MRFIKYLFLAFLTICLVTLSLANREWVTLRLLPEELAAFSGLSLQISLPLYAVILLGILVGVLLGYIGEWIREHRLRAEANRLKREAQHLEREVKRMRRRSGTREDDDDVIALLEQTPARS